MHPLSSIQAFLERLAARVPEPLRRAARTLVTDDRAFTLLVLAFNLFLARRAFAPGLWADNDSVGHLAYATYLRDEFYPQTGTFLGFSPKYNLGLPFLLFNTPPMLYVVTAATSKILGISVLAALKAWIIAAFLSIPILAALLVRTFEEKPGNLFKFALVTFSLFSSELFGLEFYFHNGMLNPAFGIPFWIATLVCQRHALLAKSPRTFLWIALSAACFTVTLLTHTLSAYMAAVSLLGVALGDRFGRWGGNVLKMGLTLGLGAGLGSFWLYPSLTFAAKTDAAYTWIRTPDTTLTSFLDGSLLSSYWGGFFPSFIATSQVGVVAILAAVVAIVVAVRNRNFAVLGFAFTLVVALWIACGPEWSAVVSIAPMYDRLLWYRFVTLTVFASLVLASYGAWKFSSRSFYWPFNAQVLAACFAWAALVMTQRAVKIETSQDYPQFEESVSEVAARLNARPKGPSGRIYSEFLGFNVVEATSVNSPREMLPILTGLDEAGGWIYENNPAGQVFLKKGPFWYNPFPILELAERYDIQYIVAGSPNFVRAISADPRWKRTARTADLELFEAVGRAPRFAEAKGYDVDVVDRSYVRGGGYRIGVDVTPSADGASAAERSQTLLVKTNHAAAWRATVDGHDAAVTAADDGLLEVALPPGITGRAHVALEWNIDDLRQVGNRMSAGAAAAFAVVVFLGTRRRLAVNVPAWAPQLIGVTGLAVAGVGLAWKAHTRDISHIGFGIADGMIAVFRNDEIRVGSFDDDAPRINELVATAWGARGARGGVAERSLTQPASVAAHVALGAVGQNVLRLEGRSPSGSVRIELSDPRTHAVACVVEARFGAPSPLPASCADGAAQPRDAHPGVLRDLRIEGLGDGAVSKIEVLTNIAYVEAESLRNVVDDGGYDAFYTMGALEYFPSNGVSMTGSARFARPIDLRREVTLPAGVYDAWGLVRAVHPRFRNTRAVLSLAFAKSAVGTIDGTSSGESEFWDTLVRFEWERFGEFRSDGSEHLLQLSLKKRPNSTSAFGDIDVLAFAPRALGAP